MTDTISGWIDWLMLTTGFTGQQILLITVPLAILQSIFGILPFATLVVLNVSALGVIEGLLVSWISCTLGGVVAFYFCRYLLFDWFDSRWGNKLHKYEKWQRYLDSYGLWSLIVLRTLPIMPNNLLSFMTAISTMKRSTFIWGTMLGNLSHIWLFGILASSLVLTPAQFWSHTALYVMFCLVLIGFFVRQQVLQTRKINGN